MNVCGNQEAVILALPQDQIAFMEGSNLLGNVGHIALGAVAALVPDWAAYAIAFLFLQYEVARDKPMADQVGSLAEFASGFMASKMIGELR